MFHHAHRACETRIVVCLVPPRWAVTGLVFMHFRSMALIKQVPAASRAIPGCLGGLLRLTSAVSNTGI